MFQSKSILTASLLAASLALAGCNGGSSSPPTPTPTNPPAPMPTPAPTPSPNPTPTPAPTPTQPPVAGQYSIGGSVSGLASGAWVVLLNNGGDNLTVSNNGSFTFPKTLASGASYAVTIGQQPVGQTCSVSQGSDTVVSSNITSVQVTCVSTNSNTPTPPVVTHSVGGTITGLATGGTVALSLNGAPATPLSANGAFTFASQIAENASYAVTVTTQPSGQTCTVSNGSGTMGTSNVTNVGVSCVNNASTTTHTVGGTVSGLAQNGQLSVHLSFTSKTTTSSTDNPLSANGIFTLSGDVPEGASYTVTVGTQPSGQVCSVSNGTGTMGTSDVTNVGIACVATSYSQVYSFQGGVSDGNNPGNRLVADAVGNLYGVTANGGVNGTGVVFKLVPNGKGGYTESILHIFTTTDTPPDGINPDSTLLLDAATSTLYGTTQGGGANGSGTIFSIKTDGTGYTQIYSFSGAPGTPGTTGYQPRGAIALDSAGYLYGTTYNGGSTGDDGVIYKVKTDGTGFQVLHAFSGNPDGAQPQSGVILDPATNTLYGTTNSGGQFGSGIVYKIQTDGTGYDGSLYQLGSGQADGYSPYGALLLDNGVLYGTCTAGGSAGYGTVFSLGTDGTGFTVLHNFNATPTDGNDPSAGVILVNGALYGTTSFGGEYGKGTVFKLNPDGTGFTQLYSFQGYPDGSNPLAGLVQDPVSGSLFGTTLSGGSGGSNGFGSVYKIAP